MKTEFTGEFDENRESDRLRAHNKALFTNWQTGGAQTLTEEQKWIQEETRKQGLRILDQRAGLIPYDDHLLNNIGNNDTPAKRMWDACGDNTMAKRAVKGRVAPEHRIEELDIDSMEVDQATKDHLKFMTNPSAYMAENDRIMQKQQTIQNQNKPKETVDPYAVTLDGVDMSGGFTCKSGNIFDWK